MRTLLKKDMLLPKLIVVLLFSLISTSVFSAKSERDTLYRYVGKDGEIVIDDHIPPEFVSKGYSILNSKGFLLEKIAPQKIMTEEEKANMSAEALDEQRRKDQEHADKQLLKRYSDSGDAVLARERSTGALATLIVVTQGQVKKLKQEEQRVLDHATSYERAGEEVPPDLLTDLDSIRSQIRNAEQQIENKKQEQERIRQQFSVIIERLKEITGK